MTAYDLEEYRAKCGLKPAYPMVAPRSAAKRQELAKIGLEGKRRSSSPAPDAKPKHRRKTAALSQVRSGLAQTPAALWRCR